MIIIIFINVVVIAEVNVHQIMFNVTISFEVIVSFNVNGQFEVLIFSCFYYDVDFLKMITIFIHV